MCYGPDFDMDIVEFDDIVLAMFRQWVFIEAQE